MLKRIPLPARWRALTKSSASFLQRDGVIKYQRFNSIQCAIELFRNSFVQSARLLVAALKQIM